MFPPRWRTCISYSKTYKKQQALAAKLRDKKESESVEKGERRESASTDPSANKLRSVELAANLHISATTSLNSNVELTDNTSPMETTSTSNTKGMTNGDDTPMGEAGDSNHEHERKEELKTPPVVRLFHQKEQTTATTRSQISYKSKLMGDAEKAFDQEFDDLVKEWLREEQELAPTLTEDQQKLLATIPKVSISDEKLKELCRP